MQALKKKPGRWGPGFTMHTLTAFSQGNTERVSVAAELTILHSHEQRMCGFFLVALDQVVKL